MSETKALTAEIDALHARRNKQNDKLQRAIDAQRAADQERKRLLDSDAGDGDVRLAAAIRLAADARIAVDTAREALDVTSHKLDDAERRLASAHDQRRRTEIVNAIDARLEHLEQARVDLDQVARAFCDLLAEGSDMGRGVATQVITGLSLSDGSFADLLSVTRSYRDRIRSGLEPLPAPSAPAQSRANGRDQHAAPA
jgi:chromosome segregation ATPase